VNTARDREQVLEQWLKQSGGARSAPTLECLDAETAGAWADGRLGGAALAEAQLHVADCARCQALMATLLRTTPQQVAAALAPKRRWLVWAMPMAAAAVLVVGAFVWTNTPAPIAPVDIDRRGSDAPAGGSAAKARHQAFAASGEPEHWPGEGTCGFGAQRQASRAYCGARRGRSTEGSSQHPGGTGGFRAGIGQPGNTGRSPALVFLAAGCPVCARAHGRRVGGHGEGFLRRSGRGATRVKYAGRFAC
jgi:hypothetical protein